MGATASSANARQPAAKAATPAAPAPQKGAVAAAAGAAAVGRKLPEYSEEEVAAHKSAESRIWVTYKGGVYDITEFVQSHPGGAAKIMLAAGGSIEPFWGLYQQHQKGEIREILEAMRIGSLKGYVEGAPREYADPFANEPKRHPALVVRSAKPFNAETPLDILSEHLVTPTDLFYVRHHLPVPLVDEAAFALQVAGDGVKSLRLSVPDLQARFKHATVVATVECAGNRRAEMKAIPCPGASGARIKGLDWDAGAIGTAVWGGVRLRDVLAEAGLSPDDPAIKHIHFIGLDVDESGVPYMASIPVHKAMDPRGDVLLAYEMNGAPIPRDHGGPLRAIVPGVVGARNVKWLARVEAAPRESQGFWQQSDYKAFSPGTDWDNVDWNSAPAIQDMNIVSAICSPAPGTEIGTSEGEITVKGYAWSGGGKAIVRVDVSLDGGASWAPAPLTSHPANESGRAWAKTLYSLTLPLPEGVAKDGGSLDVVVKATDETYNTQPESAGPVWNARGVCNNSWHRVAVKVTKD
ncbi:MAG: Oxidoreductase, molybdopterin-binding domain-containing protein [Monoraphidium minutum]|nr:MAG: Oxidoreductase, molybdopterin-binding domain-containing protein [Monoraphidium minutum]